MIIAIDAAGGDYFPTNPVEGALSALSEIDSLSIILVGPEDLINSELAKHEYDSSRVFVQHAPEIIGMEESPASAVKNKRNSSIAIGLGLHKAGKCDAFVSAGNTGALLAASTFILGKLEEYLALLLLLITQLSKASGYWLMQEPIWRCALKWLSSLLKWDRYSVNKS